LNGLLKKNRHKLDKELRSASLRQYFSPLAYFGYRTTVPAISKYMHGSCLDIGCGEMPYKDVITPLVQRYDTMDIEKRDNSVKYIGDIQNMDTIESASYDSAICLEVLEHIKEPLQGMKEMHRILKKGGTAIISVPHLSRLHEEPNDFYRFTKYGIEHLAERSGFEIIELHSKGGLFSFLGHQISTIFVCLCWGVPVLKNIVFFLNKWLCVKLCYLLDSVFDRKKIFAVGYTCVLRKN